MKTSSNLKTSKEQERLERIKSSNQLLNQIKDLSNRLSAKYYKQQYESYENKNIDWIFDIKKPETQQILFFDVLKLKPTKERGKSGRFNTDREFQQTYVNVPEVQHLDEINKLDKTFSTNIEDISERITHRKLKKDKERVAEKMAKGKKLTESDLEVLKSSMEGDEKIRINRVNSTYDFRGVVTGRSSSSNPNFQNISVRSLYSNLIKRQFIAPKGYLFIHSDLNAAEIRSLANLAQDENLKKRFFLGQTLRRRLLFERDPKTIKELESRIENEGDIHRYHYRVFYNVPFDTPVTKEQRWSVKGLVFGLVYGKTAQSFAREIGADVSVGEFLYNKFFEFYPKSKIFLQDKQNSATNNLWVKSPVNRYRVLGASLSTDEEAKRAALTTQSKNSTVQSFSSDTIYIGHRLFINLAFKLNTKYGWRLDYHLCNTVHDSLEGECKIEQLPICIYLQSVIYSDFVKKYIKKHFNFEMILPQELEMDVGSGMMNVEGVVWRDFPEQIHRILIDSSKFYDRDDYSKKVESAISDAKEKYPNITSKIVEEVVRKSLEPMNLDYTEEEIDLIEKKLKNNYEVINDLWKKESESFIKDMTVESFLYDSNKVIEVGKRLMF